MHVRNMFLTNTIIESVKLLVWNWTKLRDYWRCVERSLRYFAGDHSASDQRLLKMFSFITLPLMVISRRCRKYMQLHIHVLYLHVIMLN